MAYGLTAKQRDHAFQCWCSQIARESRDLAGLERIGARALEDRDVRGDPLLHSMVRAEVQRHRSGLNNTAQRELREKATATVPRALAQQSSTSPRDNADLARSRNDQPVEPGNLESEFVTLPPPSPPSPPPDEDQLALRRLAEQLSAAVRGRDEGAARVLIAQMGALRLRRGELVTPVDWEGYEKSVAGLLAQLDVDRNEIATLARQAQAAAQRGDAAEAVTLLRRLTALQAADPRLLDRAGLGKMRDDVALANESHADDMITRKLALREREVIAEMKRLAVAVSDYHRVVFSSPRNSADLSAAGQVYLHALRATRVHEQDWLAELVLELGDLLADWHVAPPGAAERIDHFLEQLRAAIQRIRASMGEIKAHPTDRNRP